MKLLGTFIVVAVFIASQAHAQSVRVATYNLNWANQRGDQVIDAFTKANADILCFQETTVQSEQFLREQLANGYPGFHAVGHQGQYAAERFVIASKIGLRGLAFQPPERGLFGFYSATARIGQVDVRIVNVHLTPFTIRPDSRLLDAIQDIATTEDAHAAEIEAIIKTLNKDQPTIVLGDFNSVSTFNAPQRLQQIGFIDSFASVTADADNYPTWRWPTRTLPLTLRIDYIFHSRHLKTVKSEIVQRDGSDHSLLVSELKFSEPGDASEATSKKFR